MAKIKEVLQENRPTLSFEVFPPKSADLYSSVEQAAGEIASLKPSFMSVTCGAGGGNRQYTVEIAADIKNTYQVSSLAHLTCVAATKESVDQAITDMKKHGIENVLALRGDLPAGMDKLPENVAFHHANELVSYLRENSDLCIGGACYPEGHPEAGSKDEDIRNLKRKVDAGCDFLTTQMFFDNSILYNYLYRIREAGIEVPVCAGIMPITNAKSAKRSVELSGCVFPARFRALMDRFGSDSGAMMQAGIAYATDQIIDLIANGVYHIHVYSMNKPEVAKGIADNLSQIIK